MITLIGNRFKFAAIAIILSCCSNLLFANPVTEMRQDLAIFIPSCDKYADLWPHFTKLLFKYWPELNEAHRDINIYLLSNKKIFTHERINSIRVEHDKNWSDSMLSAIEQIPAKYILIMLEDYFLHQFVDDMHIWNAFNIMQQRNAAYLQIAYSVEGADLESNLPYNIVKKLPEAEYRTSLQAAIWDKEILKTLLLSGESPWQFEKAGSIRSEAISREFLAIYPHPPMSYLNAVYLKKVDSNIIEYLKNIENIDIGKNLTMRRNDDLRSKIRPYKKYIIYSACISILVLLNKFIPFNRIIQRRRTIQQPI